MDWSLVLASQGIFCNLEFNPVDHSWFLLVAADEADRALRAIQQFRLENRGRHWSALPLQQFQFRFFPAFLWALAISLLFALQPAHGDWLWRHAVLDSRAVQAGQWWRLFTAVFLHADLVHLASNLMMGLVLLPAVFGIYGTARALLATSLAATAANLAVLIARPGPYLALGSSGLIMAALGLLAARAFPDKHRLRGPGAFVPPILFASLLLFVLSGTNPSSDVLTHVMGFLFGLLAHFRMAIPKKLRALNP